MVDLVILKTNVTPCTRPTPQWIRVRFIADEAKSLNSSVRSYCDGHRPVQRRRSGFLDEATPARDRRLQMSDANEVGERVLEGYDRGRRIAIEQAQRRSRERAIAIMELLQIDVAKGKPSRGRPGRIHRRLKASGVEISESQVRRILSRILMSVEDSVTV